MGTYNLNATDLITLLNSTVQTSSKNEILQYLASSGIGTGSPIPVSVGFVQGPSGSTSDPSQTVVVQPGTKFELITTPTSTDVTGSVFPPPVVGTEPTSSNFNFITPGGVLIGAGDQNVTVQDFSIGPDTLIGGAGKEKLEVYLGNNLLVAGTGLNTLIGGFGMDTLIGGGQSLLEAGGGANVLKGGTIAGAHDTLLGGPGADLLEVTQGANSLAGGAGRNTLLGGSGSDTLVGGGQSSVVAGSGNQTLTGGLLSSSSDTLVGGSGNDSMSVTAGRNSLVGGGGHETITLGSGMDTFTAGAGSASLQLGTGDDSITGGAGAVSITSAANLVSNSSTAVGGMHTLTFDNGLTVKINDTNSNITIHFAGGGTTPV